MTSIRLLIAESEPADERQTRRERVGKSSGETYEEALRRLCPRAQIDRTKPIEAGRDPVPISSYDAVFLAGSPLHLYHATAENRRVVEFMRAVFAAGIPSFGSCAGLQIATVAAGGIVRRMPGRPEAGFARNIAQTPEGRDHPMFAGKAASFDAISIHSDEVETLPPCARLLASNAATRVQAAEIRSGGGTFWGVQYHPELTLAEVADALTRQGDDLVAAGLAPDTATLAEHVGLIEALSSRPDDASLAWRLGLGSQVIERAARSLEIENFLKGVVQPKASERGRR